MEQGQVHQQGVPWARSVRGARRTRAPCCFILTRNGTKLIVVIYVDDFGIFHSGTTAGKALAHEYIEHFNKHVGKPLKVHEG